MNWIEFKRKYHYRCAERCCSNCKHGENDYDGIAKCHHPLVKDNSSDGSDYCVCDRWERKEAK